MMPPKPPFDLKPKPKLPHERKAVTIVAGFKFEKGIVICADTQETISGFYKRNVPKLRFEPQQESAPTASELAAIFAGATDNGPFLDKLVDDCWNAIRRASDLNDACNLASETIKNHFKEYGAIYQQGCCPSTELIFGIKMGGTSRLFYALDAIVNEQESYAAAGVGQYLADFLIPRSFHKYLNIYQCIAIAAYVLFQAKEHIEGCGGDSHIAFLRNDGSSGEAEYAIVDTVTRLASLADARMAWFMPLYADPSVEQKEFERVAKDHIRVLIGSRREYLKKLSEWNEFWEKSIENLGIADSS